MTTEMNLNEFADGVVEAVEEICSEFKEPNDDFLPIMHMANKHEVSLVAIDGGFLASDVMKDILVYKILRPMIIGYGAKMVVTVLSAWQATLSEEERKRYEIDQQELPTPSQMANREEIVIVTACDGEQTIIRSAKILRTEKAPPTLGEWTTESEANAMTGRFIDPLRDALRENSGDPDPEWIRQMEDQYGGD